VEVLSNVKWKGTISCDSVDLF